MTGFYLECEKCLMKSDQIDTSVPPPDGWSASVKPAGKGSITTWKCRACHDAEPIQ